MEQLIQSLGFPIASVIACGGFIYKMQQQQREDTNKREERMFQQMTNITTTLTNINLSLERINTRIEELEETRGVNNE
jgi:hypothetical protein